MAKVKALRCRQGTGIHVCVTLTRSSTVHVFGPPPPGAGVQALGPGWMWGTGDGPRDGIRLHRCTALSPRVGRTESWGNSSLKKGRQRMKFRDGAQDGGQDLSVRARRFPGRGLECKPGERPGGSVTHRGFLCFFPTSP